MNMLVANPHDPYDSDVYFHTVKTMAAATVISRVIVLIVVLRRVSKCKNRKDSGNKHENEQPGNSSKSVGSSLIWGRKHTF